jgi:cell division protein FtsN
MSKRHQRKHKKSRPQTRQTISAKFWFIGGLVIMFASFGWYYLNDPSRFDSLKKEVVASLPTSSHNDNLPTVHEKPHFEFYNILPHSAVEVSSNEKPADAPAAVPNPLPVASVDLSKTPAAKPEVTATVAPKVVPVIEAVPVPMPIKAPVTTAATTTQPAPVTSPTPSVASKKGEYMVQVGAFPKFADADRLKAKLIMDGFVVRVNPFDTPKGKWYRVNIGPFASATSAEQQRQRLQRAHYSSILRKTV